MPSVISREKPEGTMLEEVGRAGKMISISDRAGRFPVCVSVCVCLGGWSFIRLPARSEDELEVGWYARIL